VLEPVAHWPQPLLVCRVAKNTGGSSKPAAPSQPVADDCATSPALVQTCQPTAHRSATSHPVPSGFALSSPALRLQAGCVVSATASPGHAGAVPGASVWMPGMVQAPLQPAMFGCAATSVKPSRCPSAHPTVLSASATEDSRSSHAPANTT